MLSFRLPKKEVFVESDQKGKGVKYWWFDSSKTSLYLRKDTNSDQLYLGNDSTGETTAEYLSEASHNVDSASDPNKVSTPYGFFSRSMKPQPVRAQSGTITVTVQNLKFRLP